jgi:hypothetical protein
MATTTPDAICTAFETLIGDLTPAGAAIDGAEVVFETTGDRNSHKDWEERPEGDIDRNFQIDLDMGDFVMFGNRFEQHVLAEIVIEVGHVLGNWKASRNRKLKDIAQIISQITWPANKPTGSHGVHPEIQVSSQLVKGGKFVITRITAEIKFAIPANYGG